MRIALFSDGFYPELGGIQDSIVTLGQELARRGHTIDFYVPRYTAKEFDVIHALVGELDLGAGITIYRLPSFSLPRPTKQSRTVVPLPGPWRPLLAHTPDIIP